MAFLSIIHLASINARYMEKVKQECAHLLFPANSSSLHSAPHSGEHIFARVCRTFMNCVLWDRQEEHIACLQHSIHFHFYKSQHFPA